MENEPKGSQEKEINRLCGKCRWTCKCSSHYFLLFCPGYDSGTAPRGIEERVRTEVYITILTGRQAVIFLN